MVKQNRVAFFNADALRESIVKKKKKNYEVIAQCNLSL